MRLPNPRGPLSALLVDQLSTREPDALPDTPVSATAPAQVLAAPDLTASVLPASVLPALTSGDVRLDEDLQLALTICYELHYRGFDGVDERWEWDPALLGLRGQLERRFEAGVQRLTAPRLRTPGVLDRPVDRALRELLDADDGPSLSTYMRGSASLEQFREFVVQRSIYQLKEADPHTWAIPRLAGRAKAALVEIQMDEYGGGRPERMHAVLFATTMRELDLDDSYGAYLDVVPAASLAAMNLISLLGLHRRHRGALLGHLAVFEMASAVPSRRYGDGLRRLGLGRAATDFYDEHVEADAVHEQVAAVDMCGSYVAGEPDPARAAAEVLCGAACCLAVEAAFAGGMLDAWKQGRSSLRPLPHQPRSARAGEPSGRVA